jgi:hypothetical protein
MRAWWKHISEPSLWPNERLFFELYGQALQRRPHTTELLDGIVEDWLEPIAEINIAIGVGWRRNGKAMFAPKCFPP